MFGAFFTKPSRFDELVKKPNQHFFERQREKLHRQGARAPTNEAYFRYAAVRRGEGERGIWAFYEAVGGDKLARNLNTTLLRTAKEKAP